MSLRCFYCYYYKWVDDKGARIVFVQDRPLADQASAVRPRSKLGVSPYISPQRVERLVTVELPFTGGCTFWLDDEGDGRKVSASISVSPLSDGELGVLENEGHMFGEVASSHILSIKYRCCNDHKKVLTEFTKIMTCVMDAGLSSLPS
jgi:hypothetical protein